MYPTVVIVLVETQRSVTDIRETSTPNASGPAGPMATNAPAATAGHLSFGVLNITTDNDASESPPSDVPQSQDVEERGLLKVIPLKESRVSSS